MADSTIYGLGDKLKQLREKHHLSQREVASRLNVNRNTISRYENDTLTPSIENLIQFAIVYNTSIDYLLGIGKESYLYLHEFTEDQKEFILQFIHGLKEKFDYGKTGD